MQLILCVLAGSLIGISTYLLLSHNLMRILFGVVILTSAVNLLLFALGRLAPLAPAFVPAGHAAPLTPTMNPLPQALILTAIVIGFGLLAYGLVLVRNVWQTFDSVDTQQLTASEPMVEKPNND